MLGQVQSLASLTQTVPFERTINKQSSFRTLLTIAAATLARRKVELQANASCRARGTNTILIFSQLNISRLIEGAFTSTLVRVLIRFTTLKELIYFPYFKGGRFINYISDGVLNFSDINFRTSQVTITL